MRLDNSNKISIKVFDNFNGLSLFLVNNIKGNIIECEDLLEIKQNIMEKVYLN